MFLLQERKSSEREKRRAKPRFSLNIRVKSLFKWIQAPYSGIRNEWVTTVLQRVGVSWMTASTTKIKRPVRSHPNTSGFRTDSKVSLLLCFQAPLSNDIVQKTKKAEKQDGYRTVYVKVV